MMTDISFSHIPMANTVTTTLVSPSVETRVTAPSSLADMRERLRLLEAEQASIDARRATINGEMNTLRFVLSDLLAQEQKAAAAEAALSPVTIDDLLGDPSYADDESFRPSEEDESRRDAYLDRMKARSRRRSSVGTARSTVQTFEDILARSPAQAAQLEAAIAQIDGNLAWKGLNLFTGTREKLQRQLADLRQNIANAETQLPVSRENLAAAQQSLASFPEDVAYDTALHTVKSVSVLPRSKQSVLMSYDERNRELRLQLPASPEDNDFSVALTLSFENDSDLHEFKDLVGAQIRVNGIFDTVGEHVEREYDFEDELVPLALEVVKTADGAERFRLPQAVYERFGNQIQ
jgi:chromosome segregation ATPase